MFKRSVSKYGIYDTKYVDDDDSKTFTILLKTTSYPGKVIKKIEDLNHFSKRMKRQLKTKKREYGRKKLSDGKTISGKNRLSNKIDWCGYLKAARDGTSYGHKPHALPRPVLDANKPVFDNISSRESLARVVDALGQNPNDGFHSLVWFMSPKHKTTSGTTFEIACHLAIVIFNGGYFALDLFNNMCDCRGYYTDQAMIPLDNSRLNSESKTNNRKTRKEAGRDVQENVDNDQTNNSNNAPGNDDKTTDDNETVADNDERITDDNDTTSSSDESSNDSDGETNHMDKEETLINPDTRTNEILETNDGTSDDEDGYYNPRDKRSYTTANIILSSPHAGSDMPEDVPDRTIGGCRRANSTVCSFQFDDPCDDGVRCPVTTVQDFAMDDRFAEDVADQLNQTYAIIPFLVVAKWNRKKIDFNREMNEATFNHLEAIKSYRSYHDYLEEAIATIERKFHGQGLLLDVHQHAQGK
ncbi:unnamed protein product [Rotaria sp. Silwood1]|nr:unnamed protein product [Rotaria sp. Silwood1]